MGQGREEQKGNMAMLLAMSNVQGDWTERYTIRHGRNVICANCE